MSTLFVIFSIFVSNAELTSELPEDSTILLHSRAYKRQWWCGGETFRAKYFFGIECLERKDGVCMKLRAFESAKTKTKGGENKTYVRYGHGTVSLEEAIIAHQKFRESVLRDGHINSPFISKIFMISEALGFMTLILFPITIPVDVATMPAQAGMYYGEWLYRTLQYKGVLRRMNTFITEGRASKGASFSESGGAQYAERLNDSMKIDGWMWLCPNRW